jgi:hypothetical protein
MKKKKLEHKLAKTKKKLSAVKSKLESLESTHENGIAPQDRSKADRSNKPAKSSKA